MLNWQLQVSAIPVPNWRCHWQPEGFGTGPPGCAGRNARHSSPATADDSSTWTWTLAIRRFAAAYCHGNKAMRQRKARHAMILAAYSASLYPILVTYRDRWLRTLPVWSWDAQAAAAAWQPGSRTCTVRVRSGSSNDTWSCSESA